MNNILKKINLLGLTALFAGAGLALAFTNSNEVADVEYGKLITGGIVEWIPLSGLSQKPSGSLLSPGEYACDQSAENCSAYFPASMTPDSSTPDPNNGDQGSFRVNR